MADKWTPHPKQAEVLKAFLVDQRKRGVAMFSRQTGKAVMLNELVFTPLGWRTIADLQVGDEVFAPNGKPTKIVYLSPIYNDRKCYKVTFTDHTSVVVDASHDWNVWSVKERRRASRTKTPRKFEKLDTETISKTYLCETTNGRREYNYAIPVTQPLELPAKELSIEPYYYRS